MDQRSKYKRMATNAGMLYFRMLLTMAVTLYTSRVVLQTLGVEDFGIYHVVAGFVTMLGFLHGAMSSASQRFLAFELGKAGDKDMRGIFSMSMNIHILIALIVLLLGESLGIWFLNNHLTIPPERMEAARWVFHLALLSFMVTIISVPYNALIIAHERMGVFAWVSIIDVTLKLLVVFMLGWFGTDTLILYGLLSFVVVALVFMIYRGYSKTQFSESRFRLHWNGQLFKVMLSYTGWNLWGNLAAVMSGQGVNVLLNIFFGPTVNAARTIAMQASGALNSFVQSLQMAVNPQIIKSYAAKDMVYMHRLVCYGAKYNLFLLILLTAPVLANTEFILKLWLGTVPEFASFFLKLMIINILVDSVSAPLITSAQATGKIKLYQTVVGGILLLSLPIAYFLLKGGGEPQVVMYGSIFSSVLALIARLTILKNLVNLPLPFYIKEVLGRGAVVAISVFLLFEFSTYYAFPDVGFLISALLVTAYIMLAVGLFGLGASERVSVLVKLKSVKFRLNNSASK